MKHKGYFISIGGGKNQLPLLGAIQSKGAMSITVDINDKAPGFDLSQIKIIESSHEYRKVYSSISQIPLTEPIIGVGTRSYGKSCYTAAYLANKLKLPGTDPNVIRTFENKKTYLDILRSKGLSIPKSYEWKSKASFNKLLSEIEYPVVLKPVLGSGKKDIELFINRDKLKERIEKKYPEPNQYLLESYIEGSEVTVLGFVHNQKFQMISFTDKWSTSYAPFLEIAHSAPSLHLDFLAEIRIFIQNIVYHTGLNNTPFLAEFKITEQGDVFLLECAPEVGGEFLADYLVPAYYNYNYFESMYLLLTGNKPKPSEEVLTQSSKKVAIIFATPPNESATIENFHPFVAQENETLLFEENLKEIETKINIKQGNLCRPKVIGLQSNNNEPMDKFINQALERLGVEYK
ncbi:ATP-grasp domain-containing protein [Leptospira sp. GIMC2001]|uniref:ATP-grasp domain-containing protein n=1 Tax=Leptospira sp. GIMC2001 TaxID=1513297 RepID=UPI00234AEA89|nr:ATP-grasp domain-containing protein [Leptospira sp. GIMC2001]WCL48077.1 ATP-grasp domain-containing protein [Leptospira sp. GIMC2001]